MECDCVVSGLAVVFQLAGWVTFAWHRLGDISSSQRLSQAALTVSLLGLGVVTLVGAMILTTCALVTGLTFTVLLLAVIGSPGQHVSPDRYAALYALDDA